MAFDTTQAAGTGMAFDLTQAVGLALARLVWCPDPDRPHDGAPVGAGVLVGEGRLLTCAHVVNFALGRSETEPETPTDALWLDFPFAAPAHHLQARVLRWLAPMDECRGDVALLELADPPPQKARPISLVRAVNLSSHPFRALGFPDGYPAGIIASGHIQGQVAGGWMQLEGVRVTGARVERGFSGAPVWDDQLRAVVGLVMAESRLASDKVGFMAPASVLDEILDDVPTQPTAPSTPPPQRIEFTLTTNERVDVRVTADEPWTRWRPEATAFTVRTDPDGLVVGLHEPARAPQQAVLTAETAEGHQVTIAAQVTSEEGVCTDWPDTPSVDDVRTLLKAWADERRTVRSELFDGDLLVRDASALRVTVDHLLERREEARVDGQPPSDVPVHSGPVETAPVPITGIQEQTWVATKAHSITEVVCQECDAEGRVYCSTCNGTGKIRCDPTVQCRGCDGRGVIEFADGSQEPCHACRQQGSLACHRCEGRGSRSCDDCLQGRAICPTCKGRRRVQSHVRQSVTHEIATSRTEVPELPPKGTGHLRPFLAGGDELANVPSAIRGEVRRSLDAEVARWRDGEVLRRIRFDLVAATAVRYLVGGKEREAYLLGPERAVHAPGSRLDSARQTFRQTLFRRRKGFAVGEDTEA